MLILFCMLGIVACKQDSILNCDTEPCDCECDTGGGVEEIDSSAIYPTKVIFNNPQKIAEGLSDRIIFDNLIYLLNATPAGETIYLSIYMFDELELAQILNTTKARGVNVYLQVDQSRESSISSNVDVIAKLNEEFDDFVVLNNASESSINHNKFAIFSCIQENGLTYENIIFQSSSNFMTESTYKYQDAQVFQSEKLYQAYQHYFNTISNFSIAGSMLNFEYNMHYDKLLQLKVHFYPKRSLGGEYGGDSFVEIMDQIDLSKDGHLLVNMSAWTSTRSQIFTKLNQIVQSNIKLTIITKNSNSSSVLSELEALKKRGAKVLILDQYGTPKQNTHMKVMTFKGVVDHMQSSFVLTGTHNLTNNALRYNNETLLYFTDDTIYDIYEEFHTQLLDIHKL